MDKIKFMSDEELYESLVNHGTNPGPITETTRRVYEIKLHKLHKETSSDMEGSNSDPDENNDSHIRYRSSYADCIEHESPSTSKKFGILTVTIKGRWSDLDREATASGDIRLDEKAKSIHRIDSLNILAYVFLLILTVCTIWLFKHRRVRFLHETGLAVMYGLIIGAILRYSGPDAEITHEVVHSDEHKNHTSLVPPDTLWFPMNVSRSVTYNANNTVLKHYGYSFVGEVVDVKSKKLQQKATFDPEIFFNILLPPIIFNAGYHLKRDGIDGRRLYCEGGGRGLRRKPSRHSGNEVARDVFSDTFWRDIVSGESVREYTSEEHYNKEYQDIVSMTVLAIFNDLHVDVNLYAFVFGESVLNDAVAIVMTSAITSYEESIIDGAEGFSGIAFLHALGIFAYVFICSFLIGAAMGCDLFTKAWNLDRSLVSPKLLIILWYRATTISSNVITGICPGLTWFTVFLATFIEWSIMAGKWEFSVNIGKRAIVAGLYDDKDTLDVRYAAQDILPRLSISVEMDSKIDIDVDSDSERIVSVLFCGICQAHYTFNNLSPESRTRTKEFEPKYATDEEGEESLSSSQSNSEDDEKASRIGEQSWCDLSDRLRGAMAFALAIRNTLSEPRQIMLTTTSFIVILTVIVCGGSTTQLLA
ncbi:Sodium/hydrogen exchanger 7 [Nymphon striatum]|nr:Sodium/hydrogen exchanger 7 [Nymphon striatum]